MKTKRNLVQVCVLVLLQTLATAAHAQFTVTTNTNNTLTISGYTGPGGSVVIPTNFAGLTVSGIKDFAFWGNPTLTNITIGTNITSIGEGPFGACANLKAIEIDPQNPAYTTVGGVIFDKGETTVIQFPSGLATNYAIPDGVSSIEKSAFQYCNLTNVVIPATTTNIQSAPFLACAGLKAITVEPGNPAWSSLNGVLFNEDQTTLVQYPGGIKQGYTIPDTVITIGQAAFLFSTLTNLTISSSVTTILSSAVAGCNSLNAFTLQAGNTAFSVVNGVLFSADQMVLFQFPGGRGGSYSIPSGVTNILNGGFGYCPFLTNITIPASVTSIAASAFAGCSSLTGIYFLGNAPTARVTSFPSDNSLTLYYLPGAIGWTSPFFDVPAVLWNPQVQSNSASLGVISNSFAFNITGSTNMVVVVEASTNLVGAVWIPVATNILSTGLSHFRDPAWTNYPNRFYRFRVPL